MLDAARNPLALARFEIKRFRGLLPWLALGFILLVPLLYSGVYLAANWDPYGRLDHVPVAIVNQDVPTTVDGSRVAAGEDFVASLHRTGTFDFVDTDAATAADGLEHGRFYLVITVPPAFTTDLVSGRGENPQRAQIMLHRNDANGFVIGTITNSAQNSIARAIDETAVRSYFEAVFANLAIIRDGMQQAADGSSRLDTGLAQAHDGSTQLRDGLGRAAGGADAVASGARQVASGSAAAAKGSAQLATGLDQLDDGAGRLASGAAQVAGGTQQLADTVDPVLSLAAEKLPPIQDRVKRASQAAADLSAALATQGGTLSTGADALRSDLDALLTAHPELADDPAVARLRARVDTLTDKADAAALQVTTVATDIGKANDALQRAGDLAAKAREAQAKVDQLNDGAHQVAAGASDLHSGTTKAAQAAHTLASGLGDLSRGAGTLSTGAGSLASGVRQLSDGSASLDDGLATAASGAHELASKLADGVRRMPVLTAEQQADAAQVMAAPVDVTMAVDNPAHVYGRGLAPMFFSIALWVLGITAFFIVRPITGRVIAGRANDLRIAITAWLPLGILTVIAGWIMLAVAWLGLGLEPVHPWLTWLLVTVTALAFSAVAHLARVALGLVASAAMLVALILQLASAGGTYPPELLPPFFEAIGRFMPMTYTIDAFRIAISGGLMSNLARDLALMGVLFASCLGLLVVVINGRRRFRLSDLHPVLG